jgi:hypothetical protein
MARTATATMPRANKVHMGNSLSGPPNVDQAKWKSPRCELGGLIIFLDKSSKGASRVAPICFFIAACPNPLPLHVSPPGLSGSRSAAVSHIRSMSKQP